MDLSEKGILKGNGNSIVSTIIPRLIFAFLAFAFTLISAWNGFNFYRVLFGFSLAILISLTFEVARFACLFKFMRTRNKTGALTLTLYTITALVCAFASINAFTSEVIKRDRVNDKTYQGQIFQVKKAYSAIAAEKLKAFDQDIKYLENQVAKYPQKDYWKRRLSQVKINRDECIKNKEQFLNHQPGEPEKWARAQAAALGLEKLQDIGENEETISIKKAMRDLWGLDKATTQKIIGIVITITVELSILLLAFLAVVERKPPPQAHREPDKGDLLQRLSFHFNETRINRFVEACQSHFYTTGKLPPQSKLSVNLRPIKQYLQQYEHDHIQELFKNEIQGFCNQA